MYMYFKNIYLVDNNLSERALISDGFYIWWVDQSDLHQSRTYLE